LCFRCSLSPTKRSVLSMAADLAFLTSVLTRMN
jgi:hypothetical protein